MRCYARSLFEKVAFALIGVVSLATLGDYWGSQWFPKPPDPPIEILAYEVLGPVPEGGEGRMTITLGRLRDGCSISHLRREYTPEPEAGPIKHLETLPGGTASPDGGQVLITFRVHDMPPGDQWIRSIGVYRCPEGQMEAVTRWAPITIIPAE